MKKYFGILLLIVFTFNTYSQQLKSIEPKFSSEDYAKKSRKQLKTGLILLGGGVAMFAGGVYASEHSCGCKNPIPGLLMAGGMGMTATSIPFFISSASNKHKANLYMKKQALLLAPDINTGIVYNSVGLKINF